MNYGDLVRLIHKKGGKVSVTERDGEIGVNIAFPGKRIRLTEEGLAKVARFAKQKDGNLMGALIVKGALRIMIK